MAGAFGESISLHPNESTTKTNKSGIFFMCVISGLTIDSSARLPPIIHLVWDGISGFHGWQAYFRSGTGSPPAVVAQICNLPYRRFAIGSAAQRL
jgi:hypothetical protein